MIGFVPTFIKKDYNDKTVPFTGLSMREIFRRFVLSDGTDFSSRVHRGDLVDDPDDAANSQSDVFDKVDTMTRSARKSKKVVDDLPAAEDLPDAEVLPPVDVSNVKSE